MCRNDQDVVERAERAYARDGGKVTRFHSTRYQAGTWSHPRRVVIKVEVSLKGVNTCFVVTDLEQVGANVDAARGTRSGLSCAALWALGRRSSTI